VATDGIGRVKEATPMNRRGLMLGTGAALLSAGPARPAVAAAATTGPGDARDAILAAFDRYPLVGGMSPAHGVKDTDDFLISLIRDPRLPDTVRDIAVEGGNSRYQPILDRYIAGEDVPLSDVRKVWRDTTQPNVGFATFYEQLYPLVRRINARLAPHRRMRVVACDSPVDWSAVTGPEDLAPYQDRDAYIAATIEREVLVKGRKALLLFGSDHLRHGGGAAGIYERRYPAATFVIADHRGFAMDNDTLERRMAGWPVPSLVPMRDTWLADLDSAYYFQSPGDRGYPGVDGYLYNGPRDFLLHQPISSRTVLDTAYLAELQRRADITGGPGGPQAILQREATSSVFFYDPDHTS
jgi:hypothetical protein